MILRAFIYSLFTILLLGCFQKKQAIEQKHYTTLAGIVIDSILLDSVQINQGDNFTNILLRYGVDYDTILKLSEDTIFDVRKIRVGADCFILLDTSDQDTTPQFLVYKKHVSQYIVYDLQSPSVDTFNLELIRKKRVVKGVITSSLYDALIAQGVNAELCYKMADVYDWQIDFYRINKQDSFSVLFTEKIIDGISVGVESIHAARFTHKHKDFYAFLHQTDSSKAYFDQQGKSLRRGFLKSPVKFSRISSRFSRRRFHPVQKRYKAHLGTDYAAPHGTPIRATAAGHIVERSRKKYNGKYIKIKHNETYMTQYLHMSGFAEHTTVGSYVAQGDVIGYVGSTGLATGPHVCYRFWKNGRQVNPLSEDLSISNLNDSLITDSSYFRLVDDLRKVID